jgi:hypothetical protein
MKIIKKIISSSVLLLIIAINITSTYAVSQKGLKDYLAVQSKDFIENWDKLNTFMFSDPEIKHSYEILVKNLTNAKRRYPNKLNVLDELVNNWNIAVHQCIWNDKKCIQEKFIEISNDLGRDPSLSAFSETNFKIPKNTAAAQPSQKMTPLNSLRSSYGYGTLRAEYESQIQKDLESKKAENIENDRRNKLLKESTYYSCRPSGENVSNNELPSFDWSYYSNQVDFMISSDQKIYYHHLGKNEKGCYAFADGYTPSTNYFDQYKTDGNKFNWESKIEGYSGSQQFPKKTQFVFVKSDPSKGSLPYIYIEEKTFDATFPARPTLYNSKLLNFRCEQVRFCQ